MTEPPAGLAAALADRYRLERELGRGGMATVWLAQDVRHGRQVAVKVLHPELGAVLGIERFLAEIRTTAHLSHPGILPLFDSGTAAGQVFYVMPYVPGESLRARMDREGQLPVGDAVRIAIEVAEALAHAHAQGVIHRDIKPENILLQGGHPLLADFGIALAVQEAGGARLTQTGLSLGTPQYMSPEQAAAERSVDGRSDIYSLGAVLYEMLAGVPPFSAPTTQAVLVKLMTEEPKALGTLRKSVPDHVADAVHTALEKLPADRYATPTEFAAALGRAAEPPTRRTAARVAAAGSRRATILAGGAAGLVLGGVAGLLVARALTSPPTTQPPSRLAILAPAVGGSGSPALRRQLTLAPDGEAIVYVAISPLGVNQLVRQRIDEEAPTPIPGGDGMAGPIVSRDGRWLYASGQDQAARLPLEGGTRTRLPATFLHAAMDPAGAFWHSETDIGLARLVPGVDTLETRFADLGPGLRIMQFLDDGTAIVVRRLIGNATGPAFRLDPASGDTTMLLDVPVTEIRYTAGHLVWVLTDGSMQAAPYDPRTGERGASVLVAANVSLTGTGIAQFDVARNGTVAYIPEAPRELVFVDRQGGTRAASPERRNFHAPLFSPDGQRVSLDFTSTDGRDVWILDPAQGTLTRATFVGDGHDATWSPDGRFLTYTSARSGALGAYRTRPGSSAPPESLLASRHLGYTGTWTPDGGGLVAVATELRPGSRLDVVRFAPGSTALEPLVATPFNEQYPAVSPDGRWLAYVSDQSGREEVYVRELADADGLSVQVSLGGATEPVWRRDGRELAYRGTTDGRPELIVAEVGMDPTFSIAGRRALFSLADYVGTSPHANYDYTPDGRGFVMVRRSQATRIMVIQNLPELVRRLQGATGR